jgi:uncharacterized caspase-like protein
VARALIALLLAVFCFPQDAFAKRVALIIANGRYAHVAALKNPPFDARLIANALRRAGFSSVDLRIDLGKAAMESALRDFSRQAENAEVALIYYAGHGIESGGENYLIPTDARLERDRDLEVEGTKLDTALRMGEGAKMRIVILDACRNNPFLASMQRSVRSRSVGRGLAMIEPEGETLVVYAAKAGATAADGDGANSPFAEALAGRLVQPGLEIGLLFRSVRDDVLKRTNYGQEPFTYGSLSGNAFYFVPSSKAVSQPVTATTKPSSNGAGSFSDESLFWQGTLAANSQLAYRDYLTRYPKGRYSGLARENLARIERPASASPNSEIPGTLPIRQTRYDNGQFPNMARAFQSNGQPLMPAGDPLVAIRRFDFTPNSDLRAQIREKILSQFGKAGSDYRKQFEPIYPPNDPFRELRPMIDRHGLSINNAVDGALLQMEAFRKMGTPDWREPTSAQIQSARRQIAGAMAKDPYFSVMRGAELQTASDELWFSAAMMVHTDAGLQALGAKTVRESRERFSGTLEKLFGFPTESLRLTDQGYSK